MEYCWDPVNYPWVIFPFYLLSPNAQFTSKLASIAEKKEKKTHFWWIPSFVSHFCAIFRTYGVRGHQGKRGNIMWNEIEFRICLWCAWFILIFHILNCWSLGNRMTHSILNSRLPFIILLNWYARYEFNVPQTKTKVHTTNEFSELNYIIFVSTIQWLALR